MDGIRLSRSQRERVLALYRGPADPHVRLRAHLLLLLADGFTWATIATVLYCSSRTIAKWKKRFEAGGVDALLDEKRGRTATLWLGWASIVVNWVTRCTPRDCGFLRSRWCCRLVVVMLLRTYQVKVSDETVRRWLHRSDLVWRRPRPVIVLKDPQRARKLRKLRKLLAHLPGDEVAVFQDEVDINLNPKIGSMWMRCGKQAQVVTPGDNEKCYLAGSLNWRTGQMITTQGPRRNGELFIAHLDDLRRRLRCYRTIHVICDNAKFHTSAAVRRYLAAHEGRIVLHLLPTRAPETNPIERVWWKLHEAITRNHCCKSMNELLDLVFQWLDERCPVAIEDQIYSEPVPSRKAA